jgi:peptidylprolyl isomerase
MWSAGALTALNDEETSAVLMRAAVSDKDWRVRVNSLRALRSRPSARQTVLKLISDKNEHVALTSVGVYEQLTKDGTDLSDSTAIKAMIRSVPIQVSVREELRILLAKRLGEGALPMIGEWIGSSPTVTAQRIRAFGATRSEKAVPYIKDALQRSASSLVIIAGVESYQSIAQTAGETVQKDFLKSAVLMLAKNDAGISYACAAAFQDTSFSVEMRRIYLSALISAYGKMSPADDLEPMVELLKVFEQIGDSTALPSIESGLAAQDNVIRLAAEKAYSAITEEEPPMRITTENIPFRPFYSLNDLPLLEKYQGAVITTSKGKIKITFDKEAAPFTVLNFILLAQKKFYDSLSFHRVVNNFVIQGGDPLGNGSGGPGYSIRTEIHPNARFKSGAVGMASAGKDTEGSQWFITHCPTPHLDFRYTVFGYTPDAKIVDQIMIGDKIENIILF